MGIGSFAGGISRGFLNAWKMQDESRRIDMQEERDKRLNQLQDLQIQEANRKIAEENDQKAFETESFKVLNDLGKQAPSLDGKTYESVEQAKDAARQNSQANLRAMDNAMESFGSGTTPAPAVDRPDELAGPVTRNQAFSKLQSLSSKYGNLGAGKAQQIIRGAYANQVFNTIQQAAMNPNVDEAVNSIIGTVDDIPDGRHVVSSVDKDGKITVGYRDSKTGSLVGTPQTYKSKEDFMHRYLAMISPETLGKYFEKDVQMADMLDRFEAQAKWREQMQEARLDARYGGLAARGNSAGGRSGSSSKGARSGSNTEDSGEPDWKDLGAKQDFVLKGIPEQTTMIGADGKEVGIQRDQIVQPVIDNFDRIRTHNPGVPLETARGAAVAIASGRATVSPEFHAPSQKLVLKAQVGPNSYIIDPDVESRVDKMTGADGKPLASKEQIDGAYLQALRANAAGGMNSDQFAAAWQVVNDPAAAQQAAELAKKGDQRAARLLEAAKTISRGAEASRNQPSETPQQKLNPQAFVPTEQERAAAERMGVDPDRKTIGESISGAWDSATSAVSRSLEDGRKENVRWLLAPSRASGQMDMGTVRNLFPLLKNYPELRGELTEDELRAIQVAAKQRF